MEECSKDNCNLEYDSLVTWIDHAQALIQAPFNVTDEAALAAHLSMIQVRRLQKFFNNI